MNQKENQNKNYKLSRKQWKDKDYRKEIFIKKRKMTPKKFKRQLKKKGKISKVEKRGIFKAMNKRKDYSLKDQQKTEKIINQVH